MKVGHVPLLAYRAARRSGRRRSRRRGDRARRAARHADPRRHAVAPRPERLGRHAGGGDGAARGARGDGAPLARGGCPSPRRCRPSRSTSCAAVSARAGEHERRNAMPRFAANLSMMYPEHAFLDRFAAAARDGFRAVEFLFPYDFPAATIATALTTTACEQVLFNAPPGDFAGGERGIASLAGREEEFRERLRARPRLRRGARLPARARHGRAGAAPVPTARRCGGSTSRNLAWAAERAAARRCRRPDRADQHARHPRLLPQPPGRGARRRRRGRRAEPQGADGPVPLPDRRRRRRHEAARATCPAARSATSRSPACPTGTSPTRAS